MTRIRYTEVFFCFVKLHSRGRRFNLCTRIHDVIKKKKKRA